MVSQDFYDTYPKDGARGGTPKGAFLVVTTTYYNSTAGNAVVA